MQKLSDGAQIVLDYPQRNSDVDFNDVFGGPPRRRSSFSPDYHPFSGRGGGSGEGIVGSRRPWSGSGEMPAFGESGSPLCRSQLGDDFFSDIFPSSDSSCSSPRKPDRDPLNSSPGSRVLSPTRPLPPRCDPFAGGSSLPAQLSLSMTMAKGIDHPTFNSPTQRSLYKQGVGIPDAFGFTTRAVPLNDDLRTDPQNTFYRQSPLSRPFSLGLDKLSRVTNSSSLSIEVQSEEDPTTLEGYVSSDRFHFSIYKWAGKGVTLIMPSNTKGKIGSRLRRIPEVVLQGVGLPSCNDDMSTMTTESQSQSENPDNKFLKDLIMDKIDGANFTAVDELLPAGFESKSLRSDVTEESEGRESEFKNLRQLLHDGLDKQGNEDIVKQDAETEDFSRSKKKLYGDANANQQGPRENSTKHFEDKVRGSKVKGKVKEFIKIFNNEVSPKRKGIFDAQNRRSRGKDGVKEKVEDQVSASASVTVEETKEMSRSSSKSLVDNSTAINQISKKAENPDNIACSDVHKINDCSPEMNCTLEPLAEPTPEIIDASVCDIWESHCEDLEGCLVEELSQDQAEHPPSASYHDQIKVSDAKIREWSKGKEGNVRSLLSTLQYVLWPDSGWKPVPLVDIIEGTSVKRAYQKALLSLHPDKLQQKGASLQQKYIAEKVFDILQEAWDQFNSMSSF